MGELHHTDNQVNLIASLKASNSLVLKRIYIDNYPKVELLILKNSGTKEHAKDIYQDAFIITWNNIKNDKFIPQNESAIQGYLYTIARNKWLDTVRSLRYKKTIYSTDFQHKNLENDSDALNEDFMIDQQIEKVMHAFGNLGEPCKKLLSAFYFEKKSMISIAEIFNLDAASARNKKYRCMQKLNELVNESE